MAEVKWIKINTTMFDDEKIRLIEAMPEKDTVLIIWIKLLVLAGKCNNNGYIYLSENIPYTEEMLATLFNRPLNTIRMALQTFKTFGMIEMKDNQLIYIANWGKHQNVQGMERIKEQTKKRVAKHREKKKLLIESAADETCGNIFSNENCNVTVTLSNAIEVEEEVDTEEDTTTPTTGKENIEDYISFFNKNMGHLLTPHELEIFKSYENDGMEKEVITLALEEAVEADARDIRYIKTVLNRWLDNKITTVEAVLNDKMNFKNKKLKGRHKNGASGCNRKNESKVTGKYQGYRPPAPKTAGEVDTTGLI
ncbi:phage replisome organizer N-terminal domain-containing protein [Clostridium peptidivorans]|uniref:phage replisome organizer N-terminal domain-containing protein n=1 Tax=Clostridium peptidivorans TaxID=100174 RepID=UPI0015C9AD55|nr:phage replisome organizer N-terminal domain-containing protein [Clostridium peptidivorans]